MTLFDRIDNISPRYREVNHDIVLEFTVKGGGQDGFLTKETRYTEGKYFLQYKKQRPTTRNGFYR